VSDDYLYIFGYEDPSERKSNSECGADFESSGQVRIIATDEEEALNWGRNISERFVKFIYGNDQMSWKDERFASWIEHDPDEYLLSKWEKIIVVKVGEYPDFSLL